LCKTAHNIEYLRDNLDILGKPKGQEMIISYRPTWIAQSIVQSFPEPGQKVCVVFTDPPYNLYVPVRTGSLIERPTLIEDKYFFRFHLEDYAMCSNYKRFSSLLSAATFMENGRLFVLNQQDTDIYSADVDEGKAWRHIIDQILGREDTKVLTSDRYGTRGTTGLERYMATLFLRQVKIFDSKNREIEPVSDMIKIGDAYVLVVDSYGPHIATEKISELEVVGNSDPPIFDIEKAFAIIDGTLTIRMIPRFSGDTKINIWVNPEHARSSKFSFSCRVSGGKPHTIRQVFDRSTEQQTFVETTTGLTESQAKTFYNEVIGFFKTFITGKDDIENVKYQVALSLEKIVGKPSDIGFLKEIQAKYYFRQQNYKECFLILNALGLKQIRDDKTILAYYVSARKKGLIPNLQEILEKINLENFNEEMKSMLKKVIPWEDIIKREATEEADYIYYYKFFDLEEFISVLSKMNNGRVVATWIQWLCGWKIYNKRDAFIFIKNWLLNNPSEFIEHEADMASLGIDCGLAIGDVDVIDIIGRCGDKVLRSYGIEKALNWVKEAKDNLSDLACIPLFETLSEKLAGATSELKIEEQSIVGKIYIEMLKTLRKMDYSHLLQGEMLQKAENYC